MREFRKMGPEKGDWTGGGGDRKGLRGLLGGHAIDVVPGKTKLEIKSVDIRE